MGAEALIWAVPAMAFAVIVIAAAASSLVSGNDRLGAALGIVSAVGAVVLIGSICATAVP